MKTAVVFSGIVRCTEISSVGWHYFGPADYFLVTINNAPGNKNSDSAVYDSGLSTFSVPISSFIISEYEEVMEKFDDYKDYLSPEMKNIVCMMYNWSLIQQLPNICTYDRIFVVRPDFLIYDEPGMLSLTTIPDNCILWARDANRVLQDTLFCATPSSLHVLGDMLQELLAHTSNPLMRSDDFHKVLAYLISKHDECKVASHDFFTAIVRPGSGTATNLPVREVFINVATHGIIWWHDNVVVTDTLPDWAHSMINYYKNIK